MLVGSYAICYNGARLREIFTGGVVNGLNGLTSRVRALFNIRNARLSYGSQPRSHRFVITQFDRIFKYTGIACLTLALISTMTLSVIFTYSSSNSVSSAESVDNANTSTLADNDANSISLTFASIDDLDVPNPANVDMQLSCGGGCCY